LLLHRLPSLLFFQLLLFVSPHTAPPEIYTLPYTTLFRSLDAQLQRFLARYRPLLPPWFLDAARAALTESKRTPAASRNQGGRSRSEEHTSELQSPCNLVCRLLLEKKKFATRVSRPIPGHI